MLGFMEHFLKMFSDAQKFKAAVCVHGIHTFVKRPFLKNFK